VTDSLDFFTGTFFTSCQLSCVLNIQYMRGAFCAVSESVISPESWVL